MLMATDPDDGFGEVFLVIGNLLTNLGRDNADQFSTVIRCCR